MIQNLEQSLEMQFSEWNHNLMKNLNEKYFIIHAKGEANQSPLIFIAIDYYNDELKSTDETDKMFNKHTNYPCEVILKKGCRVMFLNNKYFSKGIYNGSIGVIIRVLNEVVRSIRVFIILQIQSYCAS
jgi:ATP-dependent exoDNAse (exonuclease V) alpha subunit